MYDTLRAVTCNQQSAHAITGAWQQTDDIRQHMLYFLENHDEQRIASDFFAGDGRKGIPAFIVSALLQQNPLMIYFGQEYGERGMDKEGFSGQDGRTTIFDYWSVDTIVRAANRKYTIREKYIYDMYRKVMTLAQTEKTITQGEMFDLMYANGHLQRQYAFLRKAGTEALLVIANFAETDTTVNVNIPAHAFDYLGLSEKNSQVTDLLTDTKARLHFKRDEAVAVEVPKTGAVVLKFRA